MLFRDKAVFKKPLFKTTALACLLESTNSCANTVHMKTFPASVLKVLIWVLATSTKICSIDRFGKCSRTNFIAIDESSYSWTFFKVPEGPFYFNILAVARYWCSWLSIGHELKCHPFSGLIDSAGELLHFPEGIPTSMAILLLFISINTLHGVSWATSLAP